MQTLDVVDGRKEKRKSGEIDIEKAIQNSRQELLSLEEQKKTRKFCFSFTNPFSFLRNSFLYKVTWFL